MILLTGLWRYVIRHDSHWQQRQVASVWEVAEWATVMDITYKETETGGWAPKTTSLEDWERATGERQLRVDCVALCPGPRAWYRDCEPSFCVISYPWIKGFIQRLGTTVPLAQGTETKIVSYNCCIRTTSLCACNWEWPSILSLHCIYVSWNNQISTPPHPFDPAFIYKAYCICQLVLRGATPLKNYK